MSAAKFAVGQVVEFLGGAGDGNVPKGNFVVLRVMPPENRLFSYRVRSARDGQERSLPEAQLRLAVSGA